MELHHLFLFLHFPNFLNSQPLVNLDEESKSGNIFEKMSETMSPGCTQIFGRHIDKRRMEPSIVRAITKANENTNPVVILRQPTVHTCYTDFIYPELYGKRWELSFEYYQGFNFKNGPQCRSLFIAGNLRRVYIFIHYVFVLMEVSFVNDYFIAWETDSNMKSLLQINGFKRSFRKLVIIRHVKDKPNTVLVNRECLFEYPGERLNTRICRVEINGTRVQEHRQVDSKLMFPDFPKNLNQTVLVTAFFSTFRRNYHEKKAEFGQASFRETLLFLLEKALNVVVVAKDIPIAEYSKLVLQSKLIESRKIDFVTFPCTLQLFCRARHIYSDAVFGVNRPAFLIRVPRKIFEWTSILKPFPLIMWVLVLTSATTVLIYFKIFHGTEISAFEAAFCPLLTVDVENCPVNWKIRIFLTSWFCLSLIINSAYSGALLSCFINPSHEKYAKSFDELLKLNYTCYATAGGLSTAVQSEFSERDPTILKGLMDTSVTDEKYMIENILNLDKKCELTAETTTYQRIAGFKSFGISTFKSVVGTSYTHGSSICSSRHDILRPIFNRFIIDLNDFGFRNKLIDIDIIALTLLKGKKYSRDKNSEDYKYVKRVTKNIVNDSGKLKPFSLQMVKSAFLLLFCGVVLSAMVMILELARNQC